MPQTLAWADLWHFSGGGVRGRAQKQLRSLRAKAVWNLQDRFAGKGRAVETSLGAKNAMAGGAAVSKLWGTAG
jgi:hypothetical protein